MKLIALMFLEEDRAVVEKLLNGAGVRAYSRLPLEGHGEGKPGWYGEIAPYDSEMIFALVPDADAGAVLDAVEELRNVHDIRHPIHAFRVDVERYVHSTSA
jgi:hypothetical protein